MATRRETQQRLAQLQNELRVACHTGKIAAGQMTPSSRELAAQYGLSHMAVARALQELVEEGVLYSVPRVGTFAGQLPTTKFEYYLLLLHGDGPAQPWHWQFRIGLEEQLSQRGGATLEMDTATFEAQYERNDLPNIAGVFDTASCPDARPYWGTRFPDSTVPHVRFGAHNQDWPSYDTISFDDIEGGSRATQHLWDQGHRRIAFLGPHHPDFYNAHLGWSDERAAGWRQALEKVGAFAADLLFHPACALPGDASTHLLPMTAAAMQLVRRGDVDAVVAANAQAAQALFDALKEAQTPNQRWPSIVTFDDDSMANHHHLSAMRLPWEELGRVCANLLWERRHGRTIGPPQHRQVPMRLITRLTSSPHWSSVAGHATLVGTSASQTPFSAESALAAVSA